MTAVTAPGAAYCRARGGGSLETKKSQDALVDGVTAPLDQVRTDKGKLSCYRTPTPTINSRVP